MVYPMGIMSGLGSPFASSIRKIAQPIDNGYRGPTQMGPQSIVQPQPRTEEELRAQYDLMRENAKRRRAAGDISQVVMAGEQPFESFLEMERLGGLSLKDASGMPDTRGPNVPGNRPPNPNNSLIDPYARPTPGMLPQPIEINPNYRPDNFRPNPNMYQRPMRRPFGFGGRPMNPFMGMGIGMMNPMGMGMFGGFPMRPPMFGGYGGYGGGYGGYGGGYNMMRPPMGFGLGGANPYGMNPYSNFGRPNPYPQPSYNMPSPYSSGMNFNKPNFGGGQPSYTPSQNPNQLYDANMRPIAGAYADPNRPNLQQGGYGSYQQPSGYGNYGGMQNPYQPQQMGNTNNFAGYGQQQAMF